MVEIIDYVIISTILFGIGIYGLVAKRSAIRMIFAIEIVANAANLNLVAFSRGLSNCTRTNVCTIFNRNSGS